MKSSLDKEFAMKVSNHYQRRMANRAFSESYLEILHRHGDYIEQKGGDYVLRLSKDRAEELIHDIATEEQELMHRKKFVRRRIRQSHLKPVPNLSEKEQLTEEYRETQHKLKSARRTKKALKSGHAICGRVNDSVPVQGVTVAHTTKKIRGHYTIKED
jgi:hypothetical protein